MTNKKQSVEEYVSARSAPVRKILNALRRLVKSTLPDVTEAMKWGAPVYSTPDGHALIYIYGGKDHANLGFLRGAELDDPSKLLAGSGKSGRHIKIYSRNEIPEEDIRVLLHQSANLKSINVR